MVLFQSMKIVKELNDKQLTIKPVGEINSVTAPELEEVIKNDLNGVKALVFDFSELEYLSSAGLRVLLVAQKLMNKKGPSVTLIATSWKSWILQALVTFQILKLKPF